jgi:hypothetical protein
MVVVTMMLKDVMIACLSIIQKYRDFINDSMHCLEQCMPMEGPYDLDEGMWLVWLK